MKATFPYPVSRKAYASFITTIETATPYADTRRILTNALNLYLLGHDTYTDELTPECRMAFEILRFNIDAAITRSQQARERARLRKEAKEAEKAQDAKEAKEAKALASQHLEAEKSIAPKVSQTSTAPLKPQTLNEPMKPQALTDPLKPQTLTESIGVREPEELTMPRKPKRHKKSRRFVKLNTLYSKPHKRH